MDNVLVICHGHRDRHIQEINYATAKFLNIDGESKPDYRLDITNPNTPTKIGLTFNTIINAFCPISEEFKSFKAAIFDRHGDIIDGELNPKLFGNIWKLLIPDGHFYIRPLFVGNGTRDPIAISLLTDKLFRFGFVLDQVNVTLTFDKTVISDFVVYRKTPIPSRQNIWDFLMKRWFQDPPIKWIESQVYESELNDERTNRFNINDSDIKWLYGESHEENEDEIDLEILQKWIMQPRVMIDEDVYVELRSLVLIRDDDCSIRLI